MLNSDRTLKLGARVAYNGDPRIKGTVAGHGTVHNDRDPESDDTLTHNVVIVRVDEPARMAWGALSFHVPFVQSVLTVIDPEV